MSVPSKTPENLGTAAGRAKNNYNVGRSRRTLFEKTNTDDAGQEWITRNNSNLDVHSPAVLKRPDVVDKDYVNFLTIIGPARQGKSFLLNCLSDNEVFNIADTIGVCTKGVQVSSVVHTVNDVNGCVIFVDTEGQGDHDVDSDITLLTPVFLLSKVIMFNWKGGLQKNKILDELAILVEAANCVSSKQLKDDSPIFGHLKIVLRDFHFDGTPEDALDKIFAKEEKRGEKIRERNKIREKLLSSFQSVRVSILPLPSDDVSDLSFHGSSKAFRDSVDKLKTELQHDASEPRRLGSMVVDSAVADTLVRKFVEVLESGDVVHLRSIVGEMQRRKVDAARDVFQTNVVKAFTAIAVPMRNGLENMLTSKSEACFQEFQETTKGVDLELVYKDEVYQQLEEFADREMEAKRRDNRLAVQSQEITEKERLRDAVDQFRSKFETKLANICGVGSSQLQGDLERYRQDLGRDFLQSTTNLLCIPELVDQEKEKLLKWASNKLDEEVKRKREDERRKEEHRSSYTSMSQYTYPGTSMSQYTYPGTSMSQYTYPGTPASPPSHSQDTSKFYKGGQFVPGGGRAPKGGCYMAPNPTSTRSTSYSSSGSSGGSFYKGGQFLPGGGRAPKGGCRR